MNITMKTQNNNQQTFSTYDLGIAASLVTLSYALLDLDKTNPRKVQFIFEKDIQIDQIVNNFWSNNLNVDARTLLENTKMLKNRIYST